MNKDYGTFADPNISHCYRREGLLPVKRVSHFHSGTKYPVMFKADITTFCGIEIKKGVLERWSFKPNWRWDQGWPESDYLCRKCISELWEITGNELHY